MAVCREFEIINERGLHARAAARLVEIVEQHVSVVRVTSNGISVSGDSIMGLLTLAVSRGMTIEVEIAGDDENELAEAIGNLIQNRFNERS